MDLSLDRSKNYGGMKQLGASNHGGLEKMST